MQRKMDWIRYVAIAIVIVLIGATIYGFYLRSKEEGIRQARVSRFCQTLRIALRTDIALHTQLPAEEIGMTGGPVDVESVVRLGIPGQGLCVVTAEKNVQLEEDSWVCMYLKGKTAHILYADPTVVDHQIKSPPISGKDVLEANRLRASMAQKIEAQWDGLEAETERMAQNLKQLTQMFLEAVGYRDITVEVRQPEKTEGP